MYRGGVVHWFRKYSWKIPIFFSASLIDMSGSIFIDIKSRQQRFICQRIVYKIQIQILQHLFSPVWFCKVGFFVTRQIVWTSQALCMCGWPDSRNVNRILEMAIGRPKKPCNWRQWSRLSQWRTPSCITLSQTLSDEDEDNAHVKVSFK